MSDARRHYTGPIPKPTPETQPVLGRGQAAPAASSSAATTAAQHYFYPRPLCPHCLSRNVAWVDCQRPRPAAHLRHQPPPAAQLSGAAAVRHRHRRARRRAAHDDATSSASTPDPAAAALRHAGRGGVRGHHRRDHAAQVPAAGGVMSADRHAAARHASPSSASPSPTSSASCRTSRRCSCTWRRRTTRSPTPA